VIVYVWRQRDAEVVAENIQADQSISGGVVVYHGGMETHERSKAQSKVSTHLRGKIDQVRFIYFKLTKMISISTLSL
jgi:superfamily II DNA helicase RecQ